VTRAPHAAARLRLTKVLAVLQGPASVSLPRTLAAFALPFALAVGLGCSFRGGDFTPLAKEPETPCSKEAQEICKDKLGSADIGNCVAREKYRCELVEQDQREHPDQQPAN